MRNISCRHLVFLSALFDTTSRALGGNWRTVLAHVTGISPLRGSLRAAPIAWSRFHSGLWLGRSIMIGWRGRRASSCQTRTPKMDSRSPPYLAVFLWSFAPQAGPGAFSASLSPPRGPSTNVSRCRIFIFQSTVERQNIFQPSLSIAEFRMI